MNDSFNNSYKLGGYNQWIAISIAPKGINVNIKNADLKCGKWFKYDNKDEEAKNPEGTVIESGDSTTIASCGRAAALKGTEGSIVLYDNNAVKICKYKWDAPEWNKTNTFAVVEKNDSYIITESGGSKKAGAIGLITLTIRKNN